MINSHNFDDFCKIPSVNNQTTEVRVIPRLHIGQQVNLVEHLEHTQTCPHRRMTVSICLSKHILQEFGPDWYMLSRLLLLGVVFVGVCSEGVGKGASALDSVGERESVGGIAAVEDGGDSVFSAILPTSLIARCLVGLGAGLRGGEEMVTARDLVGPWVLTVLVVLNSCSMSWFASITVLCPRSGSFLTHSSTASLGKPIDSNQLHNSPCFITLCTVAPEESVYDNLLPVVLGAVGL